MKFNEFVKNVEQVINKYGSITFAQPGWDNGAAFGIIDKSNIDGILIAGVEHYLGDGDTAISNIKLVHNIKDAFKHIWDVNYFDDDYGSYKDYDYRFEMVEHLYVSNCYYVIRD